MRKQLIAVVAAATLALTAVGGTFAWFTATSNEKTNTFTIGSIGLTLTEPEWDAEGADHKITPGAELKKDPTVTVKNGSEPCWVYVYVKNGLLVDVGDQIMSSVLTDFEVPETWTEILEADNGMDYLYLYQGEALNDVLTADAVLPPVFGSIKFDGNLVNMENIAQLADKDMKIQAMAIQKTGRTETEARADALAAFHLN